jgi:anti-sigma B factor antagonist
MIQSGSNAQVAESNSATTHQRQNDRKSIAASSGPPFEVRARGTRDVMVVAASGELDAVTAPRFREAITNALAVPSTALIVDLTALDFLSSAGLAILQEGHQSAGRAKQFCVVADGPATSRPMKMIALDRKLQLYPTLEDALADIR